MKPIIPHKYDIGFIVKNCDMNILTGLEPWCSNVYVNPDLIKSYIDIEQPNTTMDLYDRIKPYENEKNNEILIRIDAKTLDPEDFQMLQILPEVIAESGEVGEFELGNMNIHIININTYENKL